MTKHSEKHPGIDPKDLSPAAPTGIPKLTPNPPETNLPRGLPAIAVLIVLGIACYLGGKIYWVKAPIGLRPGVEAVDTVTVSVKRGDSARTVFEKLRASGLDLAPWRYRILNGLYGTEHTLKGIQQGRYRVPVTATRQELLEILDRPALADDVFRIPDGATIGEVRALLEEAPELVRKTTKMSDAELAKALGIDADSPEGYLAPETYHYSPGTTDLAVLKLALAKQRDELAAAIAGKPLAAPLASPHDVLTLASIIERETGHGADRALVSSVFHNRLKAGMPLQSDPTVIYGIGQRYKGAITKTHLKTPTPYNTYTMTGLPPTPIGAPTKASIEAALNPAETKYLYFVAKGDGTSEFSETLRAHNRAVNTYLRTKKAAPGKPDADVPVPTGLK